MLFDVRHVVALSLASERQGYFVHVSGLASPVLVPVRLCSKLNVLLISLFGEGFAAALDQLTGKDVRALGRTGPRVDS